MQAEKQPASWSRHRCCLHKASHPSLAADAARCFISLMISLASAAAPRRGSAAAAVAFTFTAVPAPPLCPPAVLLSRRACSHPPSAQTDDAPAMTPLPPARRRPPAQPATSRARAARSSPRPSAPHPRLAAAPFERLASPLLCPSRAELGSAREGESTVEKAKRRCRRSRPAERVRVAREIMFLPALRAGSASGERYTYPWTIGYINRGFKGYDADDYLKSRNNSAPIRSGGKRQ
ncbi:hypothetical protein HYPSUDRAFT_204939 [Hypholoma sublateritium FD-334 SS-4]|uniref:Uncharacterized protein n=1 Tax=Hypholoma sublateritium (strain FD-334 SS-4) TaxID=945553 RepID=A0A0D2M722_HYPSF|nr:hypothetical protein HYPSUDRAFT_204939 [Hypholoma sublateritium FD-334 SS-4]